MKKNTEKILLIKFNLGLLFSAIFLCIGSSIAVAEKTKPNILYIMADDLGKEWISCYGAEDIETPNIDALAAGGMKFNNAYSMPACTPSRTTLLTGKYPWRTGWANHWDVPRWGVGYFDWKKKENTTFCPVDEGSGLCHRRSRKSGRSMTSGSSRRP
jgi:hypothetical protein